MKIERHILKQKRIEKSLVSIGAMLTDAIDIAQKAKELSAQSERLLTKAHLELEELYMTLDDSVDNPS